VTKQAAARQILPKRAVRAFFIVGGILFAIITAGLGLWFGNHAPVGGAAEKSVAVLPFESVGADPAGAFFANGVQNEIRDRLATVADLKVISRSSVMQYKPRVKRDL